MEYPGIKIQPKAGQPILQIILGTSNSKLQHEHETQRSLTSPTKFAERSLRFFRSRIRIQKYAEP